MRKRIFTGVVMTAVVTGLLVLAFATGARFVQPVYESRADVDTGVKINTGLSPTVEGRVIATHTVEYVEKPATEARYIDRVQLVHVELRNFTDLNELEQWLEGGEDVTTVRFQSEGILAPDCDDYALELQRKALADGYVMSFQIIAPEQYNNLFQNGKLPPDVLHAINLVIIGNSAYYIEPQTGEIVFAAHLD